jgi:hypothetical protein
MARGVGGVEETVADRVVHLAPNMPGRGKEVAGDVSTNHAAPIPAPAPLADWRVVSEDEARRVLESRDVRRLLAVPGAGPLAGTRLVFSRVVALSEPRPERHPLWLLATALGAEVATAADDRTTHVVAHGGGDSWRTDKAGRWPHPGFRG